MVRYGLIFAFLIAASSAQAASIGSMDWMQPQVISIRVNKLNRIIFDFCPQGTSEGCQPLGDRLTGYSPGELTAFAHKAQNEKNYWTLARPISELFLTVGSGLAITSGSVLGFVAGGILWKANTDQMHDPQKDPEHWNLLAHVSNAKMARPHANFKWDFDILPFARDLDSILKSFPNHFSTCGCQSTYPGSQLLLSVVGSGKEAWQAKMNAQYICMKKIEENSGRVPSPRYQPAVLNCHDQQI